MRGQNRTFSLRMGSAALAALVLFTITFVQPAAGLTPPLQDGRPTLPPPSTPVGPRGEGSPGQAGLTGDNCAGLRGTVINWGFQNEPGVALRLGGGGWETLQATSSEGSYQFGPLGQGVAVLSVDLSAEQAATLRPMADDVAIPLRCDFEMVANLGVYSSAERPDPPATLTMGLSQAAVLPGKQVTFYLTVKNGMPHAISHVFITDLLPAGLAVVGTTATRGSVEVLDGRMVTVALGDLPQGGQETIELVAEADAGLASGARLTNTATLLYAESAADQAWASLTVGGAAPMAETTPAPAESATPPPTQTATAPAAATPVATTPATPAPDPAFKPDDELLPTTGGEGTLGVLSVGLVVAMLLVGLRRVRKTS
jgi:uncharacterized repeat protein (TIGR01451 family)